MSHLDVLYYHFGLLSFMAIFVLFINRGHCCGSPPGLEDGEYSPKLPKYKSGDSVTYKCGSGFILNGSSISTCRGYNSWYPSAPFCKMVSSRLETLNVCGRPGEPENGKSDFNNVNNQKPIKYTCSPGYILIGSETRTCINGNWSPNIPKCVSNLAYHKATKQSSVFIGTNNLVDGADTSCNVINNKNVKGSLTWVLVDLSRETRITNISVYLSKNTEVNISMKMTNATNIVTGSNLPSNLGHLCEIKTRLAIPPIKCDRFGYARNYIIESSNASLNICEIRIFNQEEQVNCKTTDMPHNGYANRRVDRGLVRYDYSCQIGYTLNGNKFTECINGTWNNAPPKCLSTKPTILPTWSPITTRPHSPNPPPKTLKTTTTTTTTTTTQRSSSQNDNNTAVVGIMGIAIGAVAASLAIVVAIVVVVCIMKRYYKKPNKYSGDYGPRVNRPDEYSMTYNKSSEGSQNSGGSYRDNSVHLYDSIKDPRVPYARSPEFSETVLNQSYGVAYSPYNPIRRYQQLLPQPPPSRTPPVYDTVTDDEIRPINAPLADPEVQYMDNDGSTVRVDSLYIAGAPRTAL